jgi:hypothetical protein
MLPVIGSCPDCRSDDIQVLSRSPATNEVFAQCCTCGADWWEQEGAVQEDEVFTQEAA